MQRHLQLRIEAQGKYLQSVLEKAQETLGRQNLGSAGIEAAKVQLSELVSKVSTEYLNSAFSELTDTPGLHSRQTQASQIADCSMDSCLTTSDGSQKDQELNFRTFQANAPSRAKETGEDSRVEDTEGAWCGNQNERKMFPSETIIFPVHTHSSDLSMSIRVPGEKGRSGTISEARRKEREAEETKLEQPQTKRSAFQLENEKSLKGFGLPYLTSQLDLNAHNENDASSCCKQFDLNGFSWN